MRIAIVHDWEPSLEQELTWRDGLSAAVRILSDRHTVRFFTVGVERMVLPHPYFPIHVCTSGVAYDNYEEYKSKDLVRQVEAFQPDVILHWADATRPHAAPLKELGKPMALAFAGGNPFGPTWALFDHIFVESQSYKMQYENRGFGSQVSTAFGTNTELFDPAHPMVRFQAKLYDACFPATYCDWKRHKIFADATHGLSTVTAGFMYPDHETHCWEEAQGAGALALPHVSPEALRAIYAASKTCVITSHWTGGSQRTVLEAMAMNVPLVVMADSDKTSEYVMDCGEGTVVAPEPEAVREALLELRGQKVNTRDYVMGKWSENHYADALEAGLKKIT